MHAAWDWIGPAQHSMPLRPLHDAIKSLPGHDRVPRFERRWAACLLANPMPKTCRSLPVSIYSSVVLSLSRWARKPGLELRREGRRANDNPKRANPAEIWPPKGLEESKYGKYADQKSSITCHFKDNLVKSGKNRIVAALALG